MIKKYFFVLIVFTMIVSLSAPLYCDFNFVNLMDLEQERPFGEIEKAKEAKVFGSVPVSATINIHLVYRTFHFVMDHTALMVCLHSSEGHLWKELNHFPPVLLS